MPSVEFLSYCDDNPAVGRWDQHFITRLLAGQEWRVPSGFDFHFYDEAWGPVDDTSEGRVIVFSAGHYAEHNECGVTRALTQLQDLTDSLPWALVIATSDEGSTFPWDLFRPGPNVGLWVQTPRPEKKYPLRTRFFGFGSPTAATDIVPSSKRIVPLFFSGQINHHIRDEMMAALEELALDGAVVNGTDAFASGMPPQLYMETMECSEFVPAPGGPLTQDSFRFYEALEAQAVPIVDVLRPDGEGEGYWEMIHPGQQTPVLREWNATMIASTLDWYHREPWRYAATSAWWQQEKRRLAHQLHDDVWKLHWDWVDDGDSGGPGGPEDEITVIMVTSPTPMNDPGMIAYTWFSVHERLPYAEVLVGIDGVRNEQIEQAKDYWEYARQVCRNTNPARNVCPFVFPVHMHQSGMTRALLEEVKTPYVMFVEHDTPLQGEIPFDDILRTMDAAQLNSMRFMHEANVLEGHEHLFLEREDRYDAPFIPTIQWSQRPHIARTDWYKKVIRTYFGRDSRTMIEDVMHGVVQHGTYTGRKQAEEAWERWRMAVYAPEGSMVRSGHLDGRKGDPKWPMLVKYDNGRPEGAPPEGFL